ncbi:trem-like transcript 4 protein isoform X1 [Choloepus didactylus]|uniref:trem-like transcript 4 protein isoform X1 n=1 Tax=Choloepus didactylus TaxID=27675 RepID=UPI00189FEBF6|nr:trem-like transcript 4 protein isoform X1 [Choloepus didactylus]XP_037699337.1 trem-like transcript 4 protein isoform X1 [Choloepus didactylus]
MAWGAPHLLLPPVLLALLALGSRGLPPEELHEVAGRTLSVPCQYPPKEGPYENKTWCQERSPNRCTMLVTTSKPWTVAEKSRYTIWDDAVYGVFVIIMSQLKEEDSGSYWCGSFNASGEEITVYRNISLLVSPAPITLLMWTSTWLPPRTLIITTPETISGPLSTNGSEPRQSVPPPSSSYQAASHLLVAVLCGLLVAKSLTLSALGLLLGCRLLGHGGDNQDASS